MPPGRAIIPALGCVVACAAPRPPAVAPAPATGIVQPGPAVTPANAPSPKTAETVRPFPDLDRPWGTSGPVSFVAASPERRWVAFCQARNDTDGNGKVETKVGSRGEIIGDRLDGFFADEPGEGSRIQAFAGTDPSGRFVAFVREGRLILRDTTTHVDVSLEADLRDDRAPFLHPRFLSFDPVGARVLYLVKDGPSAGIRVRDLISGAEVRIDAGAPELYRADFDASGRFVVFTVSSSDSNGNGRVDWPVPESEGPWMRCNAPLPRYPVWARSPDELSMRVARADGSRVVDVQGLVLPFGDALLIRDPDGALELLDEGGKRVPLVKKECAAHVIHADPTRGLLVTTCMKKKSSHSDILLVHKGGSSPLGLEVSGTFGDRWVDGAPRLVPLYPGAETVLFDADLARTELLPTGDRVLASVGTRVLLERRSHLVWHGLDGNESTLPGSVAPFSRVVRTTTVLVAPPLVVNLETGELIGTVEGRPLAASVDGSILLAERDADASTFALGPLRWRKPSPIEPTQNPSTATSAAPH